MRFVRLAVAACLFTPVPALAQIPGGDLARVSVAVKPAAVKPGGMGIMTLTLAVAAGYHINAAKPNDPDLIPTTFQAVAPAGITFGVPRFPVPKSITVSYEKQPMLVYTGRTIIQVPFIVAKTAKSGHVVLSGILNFQGCNATSCYPPASAAVKALVTVK